MIFMYKPVQQKDAIIQQKVEAFHELTEDFCPKRSSASTSVITDLFKNIPVAIESIQFIYRTQ